MGDRVLAIARKETRLLLRDPVYLGLAFGVPLLFIVLLGYQLSLDVKGLLVAVVDHDRSPWSREYVDGFVHSEYFHLAGMPDSAAQGREWIQSGRARVVLDIPPTSDGGSPPGRRPWSASPSTAPFRAAGRS
jgi:ABC-2 type transport system permease protein